MKKLAITIAAVFATLNIFAQGTVNFSNLGLTTLTSADAFVRLGVPITVGTTTYAAGAKAPAGATFTVQLFWSPFDSTSPNAPTAPFQAETPSGHLAILGVYNLGTVTIAGITPPGGMGWFEVKGWESALAGVAFNTYDDAVAAGALTGVSAMFLLGGTGNPLPPNPTVPVSMGTGHGGIIIGVPEPAILGLGLLGGAAMLLLRRRK